jgi:pilus assembly protein CpaB
MNPRQRRGVVLLLLSVIGAVGVFSAVSRYTASVAEQLGPTRPVLTLARDLPAYERLRESDVTVVEVPVMWTTGNQLARWDQVAGRVPVTTLLAGSRLQQDVLVEVPAAKAGEREFTVNVGVEASIAAVLAPDDRVDIVAAYAPAGKQKAYAQITVSGARVLRVKPLVEKRASREELPEGSLAGDTTLAVTFALPPAAVAKVVLAQTVAKNLRLALQPKGVAVNATPTPAVPKPFAATPDGAGR